MSSQIEELKVLVAVDVQNCFMSNLNGGTFLNMSGKNLLDEYTKSIQLTKAIKELCNSNDLIIFTRDMHPLNHISFGTNETDPESKQYKGVEGRSIVPPTTWPIHCRDSELKCKPRKDGDIVPYIEPKYKDTIESSLNKVLSEVSNGTNKMNINMINALMERIGKRDLKSELVKGNEISYFFYGILETNGNLWKVIKDLNSLEREEVIALQKNGDDSETGYTDGVLGVPTTQNPREIQYNNKTVVSLWKGERCNQESYSAFNYHINYDITNPSLPLIKSDFNSIDKKNTTGLFEYILKKTDNKPKKITITICGLVGDVCVMQSFLQGNALWEKVYKPLFPEGTECEIKINLDSTYYLGLGGIPPGFGNINNIDKYIEFYKTNLPTEFNNMNIPESIFVTTPPTKHTGGKRCNCVKCKVKRTRKIVKNSRKNKKSRKSNK